MSPVFLTRVSSDTRFPGATSPATCERVRLMLKEYALREHIKDSDYTGSHSKNSKSSKKKNTQTDSKSTKSKSLSMKTTYSERYLFYKYRCFSLTFFSVHSFETVIRAAKMKVGISKNQKRM